MKFSIFHFIIIQVLISSLADAQWRPLGPDYNAGLGVGRIECIAFDPGFDGEHNQSMYIGSPTGGLWKSINAGKSWTNEDVSTDFLDYPGIADIAISPKDAKTIYIAQGTRYPAHFNSKLKVFKSINGGAHWEAASSGIDFNLDSAQNISRIIIHPQNPDILYTATSEGVFKSTNAGKSWKKILKGNYHGLEFMPGNPETIYASGLPSVFPSEITVMKSTDAGESWMDIGGSKVFFSLSNKIIDIAVCKAPNAENNIYALVSNLDVSSGNDLFISTDAGKSWKVKNMPFASDSPEETSIAVSPVNPEEIYVGKAFNFYKSSAAFGKEIYWDAFPLQCYGHSGIHDIAIAPVSNEVFVASDGGLQNATNCRDLNNGLNISNIWRIDNDRKSPSCILAGTQSAGALIFEGLLKDKNKWKYLGHHDAMEQIINRDDRNSMISASPFLGIKKEAGMILCTKDHWISRFSLPSPAGQGALAADILGPIVQDYEEKNAYYFGYNHLFKALIDFKKETVVWTQKSKFPSRFGVEANNLITSIALSPLDNKVIFVSLYTARIFKSIIGGDGGTTTENCLSGCWSEITPVKNLSKKTTAILALNPDNANNLIIGYSGDDKNLPSENRIMKSIDRVNFIPFAEGVPNVSVNDIVFLRDKNLSLLLATDAGVYYRNENMNAWQIFADSLPHVSIKDIEINDAKNLAIVGTMGRGVWQAPLPCSSKDNVLKIDLNETWNNGKRIDGDIIIQKARVLTINSNVSISNGVKIVLEPFAKLVLNKGGKITNNENWGDAWEGNIIAEENASIIFHEGSSIRLKGKGGMLIKSGTMPASLIFNSKAEFFLSDEETFIKVKGKMQSLDGGKIPVFGKGKVL